MNNEEIQDYMENMPDEVMNRIAMSMPWQIESSGVASGKRTDSDGFGLSPSLSDRNYTNKDLEALQTECWRHFCQSAPINTSVRDTVGRLCGSDFSMGSEIPEINDFMQEIIDDPRNRLMTFLPKYVGRSEIEGELFLVLTAHEDGFIEIDFQDPSSLKGSSNNFRGGILFHPSKPQMPLAYSFERKAKTGNTKVIIPSIFVAYYPDTLKPLLRELLTEGEYKKLNKNRNRNKKYLKLGGFDRFVTSWDKGMLTERNISHLRTSLEWMNHYKQLKQFEIDHKKSSGSYLWVGKFEDPRFFKLWLSLTDAEKAKTGLFAKKTPGGTLILPPGLTLECKNPQLSSITGQDNDIMELVVSGLNKTSGQVTGSASGTYASANANRAPQADRLADEIEYFKRFLTEDLWRPVLYLRAALTTFKLEYPVKTVVGFEQVVEKVRVPDPEYSFAKEAVVDKKEDKKTTDGKKEEKEEKTVPVKKHMIDKEVEVIKPIVKTVMKPAHKLLDFNFPVSEVSDLESRARALLGVKHGSVIDTLGIPREEISRKLGFGGYGSLRRRHATEDESYPALISTLDQESVQESKEAGAEPSKSNKPKKDSGFNKTTTVLRRRKK